MKVFSVVDKIATKKMSVPASLQERKAKRIAKKKKFVVPPRDKVSAAEIRSKVAAHTAKFSDKKAIAKARMAKFNSEKLADLQDIDKKHVGDVGLNDPNDLATHGKLKSVLSMGGFAFNDKEREALSKILQS